MNYFPSPPASPTPSTFDEYDDYLTMNNNNEDDDKVTCGSCDKPLASDWFCSDCHKKCTICNRFLSNEQCSRCWVFDSFKNTYVRKQQQQQQQYFIYSYNNSYYHHPYFMPSSFYYHHPHPFYNQQHQQQQQQPYTMVPLKH
ncbi:unnamed protein product [Cunninghamella echinulata]